MAAAWFRIVKDYPNKVGPTIPFILGALRRPVGAVAAPDASRAELRALLVAMRDDTPAPHNVVIQGCTTLGEPVVALSDHQPGGFIRLDSVSKPGRALYCGPSYGADVHDFESLAEALWERYAQVISEGRFSFRNRTWHPFDQAERAKLKSHCNIAEDAEDDKKA